ncbi:hypothetical protein Fmac_026732 [Flemingia macrophylla]|uniref:Uncharacterized protein n=1 Tax=Flemingia macrophylla TaxID=520843 RepID=A0ABD1LG92_9FABA
MPETPPIRYLAGHSGGLWELIQPALSSSQSIRKLVQLHCKMQVEKRGFRCTQCKL